MGLNKGKVFFLYVGRVWGAGMALPGLPAAVSYPTHTKCVHVHTLTHIHKHACMHTRAKAADLYVAHGRIWGFLRPVWELLVACSLCIEQVGQRAQLEMVTI